MSATTSPFPELEIAYERIADALDGLPESQERLFLAKLALALAHRVPGPAEVAAAIEEARADLAQAP
jgi:hypothetical protein